MMRNLISSIYWASYLTRFGILMKKSSLFIAALPLAPSYCSKHRVTSQGWNYPVPRGEDTMDREFTADLSIQLPYHVPPEGFRMSSDSRLVE